MSQKIPLALISCGSFNPITNMHLRMFELAKNYFEATGKFNVIKGIVSPVNDAYKKKGLIESKHRCEMVNLALKSSNWIQLSTWESENSKWTPTLDVLNYHKADLVSSYGNDIQLMFLCGGDLVETFCIPGVWQTDHIKDILNNYGLAVINRHGSDPQKVIYEDNTLYKYKHNIHLITDWIVNDISSTKIRRAVSRNESIKYLVHENVEEFIKENKFYQNS